jgi:hypothetical protein
VVGYWIMTDAVWKYRCDDGRWEEYSAVLNKKIENAYQKGERVLQ